MASNEDFHQNPARCHLPNPNKSPHPCPNSTQARFQIVQFGYKKPLFYNVQPDCIMGFDLSEEGFTSMDLPHKLGPDCKEIRISHSVDEKSVALFVCCNVAMGETWDLWMMNDYGKVESWTMKYTIVLEVAFYPLKIVNGGEILAAVTDEHERLVLIDVEKHEAKDLEVCGYVPSLALLDVGEKLMNYFLV